MSDLYGGSFIARKLGEFSVLICIAAVFVCFGEPLVGLGLFGMGAVAGFLSFLLSGGSSNPALQQDRDILVRVSEADLPPEESDRLKMAICLVRLSLVVAAADGRVDAAELDAIRDFFRGHGAGPEFMRFVESNIVNAQKHLNLNEVLSEVRRLASPEEREVLLFALLKVAAADGELHPDEMGLIFALAFELGFSEDDLRRMFVGADDQSGMTRNEALEILEVDERAAPDDIRSAYRRLAQRYHPDKVQHMGPEFAALAHERMSRINEAYSILTA